MSKVVPSRRKRKPAAKSAQAAASPSDDLARYAVVQMKPTAVLVRMLPVHEAEAYARQWSKRHGKTTIVKERFDVAPESVVLADATGKPILPPAKESAGMFSVAIVDFLSGRVTRIVRHSVTKHFARGYVRGFNSDEAANPSGLWAVAVPSTSVSVALLSGKEGGAT